MGLDHSEAFVRIAFDGLIGFCICRRGDYECEMGMVQTDDHEPLLTITRIRPNGGKDDMVRDYKLTSADSILIEALAPVSRGASTFTAPGFDRLADIGDQEDFRWIMDLQAEHFHGELLRFRRDRDQARLRPRITIPHAVFYTWLKTSVQFERFAVSKGQARVPIGKVADKVGADILCNFDPEGQKTVNVKIGEREVLPLLFYNVDGKGFRYEIEITNLCRRGAGGITCPQMTSDFTRYYEVAADEDEIKYDLRPIYPPGDPRGTTPIREFDDRNFPAFARFKSNGPPEICSCAFFGRANSLP